MTGLLTRVEAASLPAMTGLPRPLMRRLAGPHVVLDGQTLDLETQWLLRLQQLTRMGSAEELPIPAGRQLIVRQARATGGRQPIGAVEDLDVPGGDGPIGARLYTPRALVGSTQAAPLLVFVHGGGMIYGDLDSHDAPCRVLAERAGVRVLALDYRLAPEHPYPAAVEDCWAAYRWVAEHAERFHADPERLAVGGDSAGGYLAAVTALKAAEAGVPCAFQLLVYPVTNWADPSSSRRMFGQGFYLSDAFIRLSDECYVGADDDRRDPLISVAYTEKVPEGLAPALVVTAGFDPLRDEGEAWARRLADDGVPVRLRRHPGLIHGFFNVVGVGRSCPEAVRQLADDLAAALHA